ncbi:acetyl-CoA synthetase [Rhodococcus sp. PvR044]|uniref:AMP-binding protein n=1 Tax=unclassified Rhodococcus (in: high G+C Gram-positive bacteria) TaxID=192944 RepID=UPI000BD86D85|nr:MULTISPECIES: AMP-binding protein [unclassified Rhodococcus (in: high G+C Gram-positive bacteria)]PTR40587.1 acetyl-CoA synthetase [Rhodococcus sp. OK611]SNX92278.1 acetyl-CoA synthetase [Rhodococcus sp. OK270]
MGTDATSRVRELLEQYDTPQACAADLLCDRHPDTDVAFTVIEGDLTSRNLSYGELRAESTKFAAALAELGVEPGDCVATLMGKSAELVIALLGIWRRGAVHVPLFTAFASPAIAFRLGSSGAKFVVSDQNQLAKLAPGEDIPADASWRVIVAAGEPESADQLRFDDLLAAHTAEDPAGAAVAVGGNGPMVQLFTSGTTGTPKGVPVPVRALASFHAYQEFGLDVRSDDVFWNAADPGWAYGLYYALLGPLAAGTRSLLLHSGFSAPLTWQIIEKFGVTNFAAAPTVYRSLRADTTPVPEGLSLRRASSAGEPLTPDVVAWSQSALGVEVRDHYGQTEHGMFIVNAWADGLREDVRPGSMGRPLPGWSCAVLLDDADEVAPAGTPGRVAIDAEASPLMWFTGYVDAPEKTAQRFSADGRWYITGDAGKTDEDGHFFFSSRDDDVIIMAGYRIGPFDVESVLVMHEHVIEAAVVGMPDELRGEVLEAFVVLRDGALGTGELEAELQTLVKKKFAAHAYPRTVHFVPSLPKTPSGKVQRYLLRQK